MPPSFVVQQTVANHGSYDVNPAPMRRSFLAVIILAVAACVDVPDGVRAQFAGPGAADRSNYRPGTHGSALPAEEPPAPKTAEAAVAGPASGAERDAGTNADAPPGDADALSSPAALDGGAS